MVYIFSLVYILIFQSTSGSVFLNSKIETDKKTYEGLIRWYDGSHFWFDLLQGEKVENPYLDYIPEPKLEDEAKSTLLNFFGFSSKRKNNDIVPRNTSLQFGHIKSMNFLSNNIFEVILRNDSKIQVRLDFDDFDKVTIWGNTEDTKIRLRDIRRITFTRSNRINLNVVPLYGTVYTEHDRYTGFVFWDQDEQLNFNTLEGDDSNDIKRKILFSQIDDIEKINRYSSKIFTKDRREFILSNSNDVNYKNNGIRIYNQDFGFVTIPWKNFKKITFSDNNIPKITRRDFQKIQELEGSLFTLNDEVYPGKFVYDLDEKFDNEFIEGYLNGNYYQIPFRSIKRIQPRNKYSSVLFLSNFDEIVLEDMKDVNRDNDGVLVLRRSNQEKFIDWINVKSIILN